MTTPTIRLNIKPTPIIRGTVRGVGIPGPPGASGASDWSSIANKPLVFPPSAHSHALSDITGLGTGVGAALAIGVGSAGGPLVNGGAIAGTTGTFTGPIMLSTYTDESNLRRLRFSSTTAGAFSITAEGLGTGASGNTLTIGAGTGVLFSDGRASVTADGSTFNVADKFQIQNSGLKVKITGNPSAVQLVSSGMFGWVASTTDIGGSANQTALAQNAAGVVEINNGTAGAYRDLILRDITVAGAGLASTPPVSLTGTWFTGGTSTTTTPQLLIEPTGTTSTSWNTNGTGVGLNANASFFGDFISTQRGGTVVNTLAWNGITSTGQISGSAISATGAVRATTNLELVAPTSPFLVYVSSDNTLNTVSIRRGANGQALRIYGTSDLADGAVGSGGSNYRRLVLGMTTAGAASITAEGLGTGASGNTLELNAPTVRIGRASAGQGIVGVDTTSNEFVLSGGAGSLGLTLSTAGGSIATFGGARLGFGNLGVITFHANGDGRGAGDVGFTRFGVNEAQITNGSTQNALGSLRLTNLTATGTIGFSQSRLQQPSAQVLQTQCFDTTLSAWQETTRSQASATGARWSVFGATPIVQQSLPAAATDAATTQTLCNAIRSLLISFGFSN